MYSDSILMSISVQTVEKTPLIGFQGLVPEICPAQAASDSRARP
jgi:hypothetical protein